MLYTAERNRINTIYNVFQNLSPIWSVIVLFSGHLVLKRQGIKYAGDNNKSQVLQNQKVTCAPSEDPDQPVHLHSQISFFNTAGPNLAIECT